jgi:hypothetical protein
MTKYITEILTEINDDPKKVEMYKTSAALRILFEYAFDPEKKFILPDGEPPYKLDAAPIGMSPANIYQELKKFYVFCRKDLTPVRRETLFIQLLENVHPSEAKLLLAVKEQNLTKLYPKITHKLVHGAGFISVSPPSAAKKETKVKNDQAPSGAETS